MFLSSSSRESTEPNRQQTPTKQRIVDTLLNQHRIQQLELSQRLIPFLIQQLKDELLNHHPSKTTPLQMHHRITNHLEQFPIKFKSIHVHMIFMSLTANNVDELHIYIMIFFRTKFLCLHSSFHQFLSSNIA